MTGVAWGSSLTADGQAIDLGDSRNVVWGSLCNGSNCEGPWTVNAAEDDDSVVWGTDDADSVVWGTSEDDDSVVWGTSCGDPDCEPVIWTEP